MTAIPLTSSDPNVPFLLVGAGDEQNITETQDFASGYRSKWSLKPLLDRLASISDEDRTWLMQVEDELAQHLSQPPAEQTSCPLKAETSKALLRYFFPPVNPVISFGALCRPLDPTGLMVTDQWLEELRCGSIQLSGEDTSTHPTTVAGMLILNQHYDQKLDIHQRRFIESSDEQTGLITYYSLQPNYQYVKVEVSGKKPELSEAVIRKLLKRPEDTEFWLEMLPPKIFSFSGIQVAQASDMTSEVVIRKLQILLMKRESVLSDKRLDQMQEVLRNYFRVPDLRLGILALDYPRRRTVRHSQLIRRDILADRVKDILAPELGNTIYYEVCADAKTTIFDDLRDCRDDNGPLDEMMIEEGYLSLILVPLLGRGRTVIGMLELASSKARAFHNLVLYQIDAVVPLFRQAMRRSRDEMEAKVQTVMRQTFTALDPSVEWRFIEAAADIIEREQQGDDESTQFIPDIRFEDVWALYAQADIVGSSKLRNEAMREDLIIELSVAEQLLAESRVQRVYPLAGKLVFDIHELLKLLDDAMSPGDEQQVQEFLQFAFTPMFEQLRGLPEMSSVIGNYLTTLEAARPNGLTKREGYEKSVRAVTGIVTRVITKAQESAQMIVPHYFSKYRTDGVEYNIYAGQSLLQTGTFNQVHLQNLRLWQLQTMVDVTKTVARLESRLPMPMLTAQLIFAFGTPITIQFRMDEKRFDVEGAYNVRYEIIKKRIDKALVRGTEERLTLANHVAVVYSHHSDAANYRELIEYLHSTKQIVGEVEELELEPMQGVDGLSALRVRVL